MPIYEYKCDKCETEREITLPFSESNKKLDCECGQVMRRKFSLAHFTVVATGKDKVLRVLNKEGGYDFPGGEKHRKRYEQTFATGLDPSSPTIGVGF